MADTIHTPEPKIHGSFGASAGQESSEAGYNPLFNTQKRVLENGVELYATHAPGDDDIQWIVRISAGSENDPEGKAGLAHVYEHVCFLGTDKRSAFDISASVNDRGGNINASTTYDATSYELSLPSEGDNLEFGTDLISDIIKNTRFRGRKILKEVEVIANEHGEGQDDEWRHLSDFRAETVFYDQPHAKGIIGSEEEYTTVTAHDLRAFHRQFYVGPNVRVFICGNQDPQEMLDIAQAEFSGVARGHKNQAAEMKFHPEVATRDKQTVQNYCMVAWPCDIGDRDGFRPEFYMLQNVFDRFLGEQRQRNSSFYGIEYTHTHHLNGSVCALETSTRPETTVKMIDELLSYGVRGIQKYITPELFETVKQNMQRDMHRARHDINTASIAELVADSVCYFGDVPDFDKRQKQLQDLTHKEFMDFVGAIFIREPAILALGSGANEVKPILEELKQKPKFKRQRGEIRTRMERHF